MIKISLYQYVNITDKALCEVPTFCDTDIVLVAKVNSLEGLPHYTFQLTLGYPAKDREKHKDGLIIAQLHFTV